MEFNIINILYLIFRFAPFIIISYFTLQSIFNQDLKGVIYLIGLLVACVVTITFGFLVPQHTESGSVYTNVKCNQFRVGPGDTPLSRLPLSQTVFGFTLAYLSYFISINNLVTQNIPTFVIFPIIILADIFWNTINNCSTNILLLSSLILGGFVGSIWALIIDSTNSPNLAYYGSGSSAEVCSKPSKSLYRCRAVNANSSAIAPSSSSS
jgi:hypothetical protein